jgi:hypothetical protein
MPTKELCFVALLDVLGFSSLVAGDRDGERLNRYLGCLQGTLNTLGAVRTVEYVVFSDTIVLTTPDDSEASLLAIITQCSRVFGTMLDNDIPLRGAIAHGFCFRSDSPEGGGTFVAGRAILDAYKFEMAQDWVGIMLAPSIVQKVPDLRERCALHSPMGTPEDDQALRKKLEWAAFVQPCGNIPFHTNNPLENYGYDGFAIVPTNGNSRINELVQDLDVKLKKLLWLKSLAPDPRAQSKYQHCYAWLYNVNASIGQIASWHNHLIDQGKLVPDTA